MSELIEAQSWIEKREDESVRERMALPYVAAPWNAGSLLAVFTASATYTLVSYFSDPSWWLFAPGALATLSLIGAFHFSRKMMRRSRSDRTE